MSAADPMGRLVDGFPDMLAEAWETPLPGGFALPDGRTWIFAGMGGSGMAGALAAEFLSGAGRPTVTWHHPDLPPWAGAGDRMVLASYSGATWEALSLFDQARARKIPVRVVGSGGDLLERCARDRVPFFRAPGGLAPRAALPWLLVGALRASTGASGEEIDAAVRALRVERDTPPADRDPELIGSWIADRLAIFLPVGPLREVVALRWRNQILENAKQAAFVSPLPEMAHHELMGWGWLHEQGIPTSMIVLPPRWPPHGAWASLLPALEEEARRGGHRFHVLPPHPAEGWAGILADLFLGDRLSLVLARRRGVAATPIAAITRIRDAGGKEPRA
jgi:glucose/mannose-6-phosphate isomerase